MEVTLIQSKEVKKWRDEEALKRYQMIAPLLDEDLDEAKRRAASAQPFVGSYRADVARDSVYAGGRGIAAAEEKRGRHV